MSEFQLVMLPLAQPCGAHAAPFYRSAFECWTSVWTKVHEQFQLPLPVYADNFMRQDEAAAIFHKGEVCVGLALFRTMDFAVFDYARDSHFKDWTDADMAKLLSFGKAFFLGSHLTVHPQFRNYSADFRFKQVIMDFMLRRFLQSNADAIVNTPRRDFGVSAETMRLGATIVRENVSIFGGREHVDFTVIPRHQLRANPNPSVRDFTDELWARRLELSRSEPISAKQAG